MKSKLLLLTTITLLSTATFAKGGSNFGSSVANPISKVSLMQLQNQFDASLLTNTIIFEGQIADLLYTELLNGSGSSLPVSDNSSNVEAKDLTLKCTAVPSKKGYKVKCKIELRTVSKAFPDALG